LVFSLADLPPKVVSRFLFHASFLRNRAGGKATEPCETTLGEKPKGFQREEFFALFKLAFEKTPLRSNQRGGFFKGSAS
jgi:hypothetical protein